MKKLTKDQKMFIGLQVELDAVKERISDSVRRRLIKCAKCGKKSRISSWVFVQVHYYVRPQSCSAGDYWLPSDKDVCSILCKNCGCDNYIFPHPQKELILDSIQEGGMRIFKSITETHEK